MDKTLSKLDRPNSYIGRSVTRPNAKRLLAGKGRYVTDLKLPRMLHAAFVRSPYAHAGILSIDAGAAAAMHGVHLIASGKDLAKLCKPWVGTLDHFRGMKSSPQLPLATDKVVWAGQAVVAVVAQTRALAEDAAELVNVTYQELDVVTDIDDARREYCDHQSGTRDQSIVRPQGRKWRCRGRFQRRRGRRRRHLSFRPPYRRNA